jgi:hypothetical protein
MGDFHVPSCPRSNLTLPLRKGSLAQGSSSERSLFLCLFEKRKRRKEREKKKEKKREREKKKEKERDK